MIKFYFLFIALGTTLYVNAQNLQTKPAGTKLKPKKEATFNNKATAKLKARITSSSKNFTYDQINWLRPLIMQGADVNIIDAEGTTPLYLAVKNDSISLAKLIIEKGADVNALVMNDFIALHIAARGLSVEGVRLLLENGATVDKKDNLGSTPLHGALSGVKSLEVAQMLVEKGADVNVKDNSGISPLRWAAYFKSYEVVNYLISKGADVNAKGKNSNTALHQAAWQNAADVISLLLVKGADINAKTVLAEPVKMPEAEPEDLEMAYTGLSVTPEGENEINLLKGYEIEDQDYNGWTPLHFAVQNNSLQAAKLLLEKGADIKLESRAGKTASNYAKSEEMQDLLKAFEK